MEKSNLEIMLGHIREGLDELTEEECGINLNSAKAICDEIIENDYFKFSEYIMDFIIDRTFGETESNLDIKELLDIWENVLDKEKEARYTDIKCLFNLIMGMIS